MIPPCVVPTTLGKIARVRRMRRGDRTTGPRATWRIDTVIDPIVLKGNDGLANRRPTRTVARHARFL